MLDDLSSEANDRTMHSVAHGVIRLEELSPEYGPERRRLRVIKYRGQRFRGGYHDFVIETGGVRVFPRLVSAEHDGSSIASVLASESPELNALLGGGIERGSSVLILGPAGTGKSLLALTLRRRRGRPRRARRDVRVRRGAWAAVRARQGARHRSAGDGGRRQLIIEQVDAAELTPGRTFRARPPLRRGQRSRAPS